MTYDYPKLLDGAHELQTMAKAEWDKSYLDSAKKALTDLAKANAKRIELNIEGEKLATLLMKFHSLNDQHAAAEVMERIARNIKG